MFKHYVCIMKINQAIGMTKAFNNSYEKAIVNMVYTGAWLKNLQKKHFGQFDLTAQQFNILRILRGAQEPLSTAVIRERMLDKMSDVSRIVDRLEKKDFVVKSTCESDQRKVDVGLTQKAIKTLKAIDKKNVTWFEKTTGLTKKEADQLSECLNIKKCNMKFLLVVLFAAMGFNNPGEVVTKEIVISESVVSWKGYKVLGNHTGEIRIKEGNLDFEGDKLVGGEFTIDMSSISSTDLEGETAQKLIGHLSSPDFFGIATFPTANFKITKVVSRGKAGDYKITGDITIKGKTEEISFNAVFADNVATASTKIDRSKFDVRYGSGSFFQNLGDNTIYDEFDLDIKLVLK